MIFSYWTFYFLFPFILNWNIEKASPEVNKQRITSRAETESAKARENFRQQRYATALGQFVKSAEFAATDHNDTCRVNAMVGMANCYRNLNRFDWSAHYLDAAGKDPYFEEYQNTLSFSTYIFSRSALYRKLGDTLRSIRLIDSAINFSLRWVLPSDTFFAVPYELKAFIFFNQKNLDSSLFYYKKALSVRKLNRNNNTINLKNIYIGITKIYELNGNIKSLLEYIDPTLELLKNSLKTDTSNILTYYSLKYVYNIQLGKFHEALQNVIDYESYIKNNPNYISQYISCQITKSDIYFILGDYDRSESLSNNLISNKEQLRIINPKDLIKTYFNLALISYNKNLFNNALLFYQKCVEIGTRSNNDISAYYNGLGSCNFLLGDTIKAEHYYRLALRTRKEYNGSNTPLIAGEYLSYSIFLKLIGKTGEGFKYVNNAVNIYKKYFGNKNRNTSEAYSWLGTFYLDGGQPEKAVEVFQRALVSAVENFGNYNVESNPDLSGNYYGPELIEALKYKARALDSIFRRNPGRLNVLLNEFKTYDLVLKAIHKQRTSFPELTSKLSVSGNEKATFLGAIDAAFQLYRYTGDPRYKAKALDFAEKSRSAVLLASLREKRAISYGGLPDSLVEKEKSYSLMIEKYQGMLLEERQKANSNAAVVKEIENNIFQLKSDQNDLIARFEKQFPQYFQLKYSDKILEVKTLQNRLSPKDVILEYAVTDRNILIFAITSGKFVIIPVSRTPAFDESLQQLNTYLNEVSFISQDRKMYEQFIDAAYTLYTKLIRPAESIILGKELIIIPDETLSQIPFEVLLTAKADPQQEFSTLPYLIEKYPIGYAYSANLLFYSYKRQIPEKVRLAAFCPVYDNTVTGNSGEFSFKPLKFAKEEVKAAGQFFRGRVFENEEATETNFREVTDKYDILHLAMHAVMDNENPMYSKLAFTKEDSKKNDGYLNTYELFNIKLKARMVVLSACNTGAGTLQKGEGIMSLARGFYYAGCPDVVMTLWPVEDKMGTQLITDFYTYLSQGMNKIQALRLAKLNLINSSDPLRSHPFFWAGYVNIGDISPVILVTNKKPTTVLWVLIIGISLLLIIIPYLWKKKKP